MGHNKDVMSTWDVFSIVFHIFLGGKLLSFSTSDREKVPDTI